MPEGQKLRHFSLPEPPRRPPVSRQITAVMGQLESRTCESCPPGGWSKRMSVLHHQASMSSTLIFVSTIPCPSFFCVGICRRYRRLLGSPVHHERHLPGGRLILMSALVPAALYLPPDARNKGTPLLLWCRFALTRRCLSYPGRVAPPVFFFFPGPASFVSFHSGGRTLYTVRAGLEAAGIAAPGKSGGSAGGGAAAAEGASDATTAAAAR